MMDYDEYLESMNTMNTSNIGTYSGIESWNADFGLGVSQ